MNITVRCFNRTDLHATRNLLSCNLYKSANILQTVVQPEWGWRSHGPSGVTRLDGDRGKKQVWRPHVTTWSVSQAKVLYWIKYLWHYWYFLGPPQWFGPRIVIRRPGNCVPLLSLRYAHAWLPRHPTQLIRFLLVLYVNFYLLENMQKEQSDSRWRQWLTTSMTGPYKIIGCATSYKLFI